MRTSAVASKWSFANYKVARAARLLAIIGALGACQRRPPEPPRPEVHRRVEELVVKYIQAWRDEVAVSIKGSLLYTPSMGRVVGEERMRTVAESLLVFQDMRAVCGSPRTPEQNSYNTWFSWPFQELFARFRLPRSESTGYCPYWGPERQRAHTLVQHTELELPAATMGRVRALRMALLDSLRAIPDAGQVDSVTIGQITRFAIDAARPEMALPLVQSCAATRVFCRELEALLVYATGALSAADSLFAMARASRTAACDDALAFLLAEFENVSAPCGEGALSLAQQEQLWWAADPLWTTVYNERRIEHERRRLDHALRRQVRRDEFLDYTRAPYDSSSLAFQVRYGQPTAYRSRHSGVDRTRGIWFQGETQDRRRLLGAFNYSFDRRATIPSPTVWSTPHRTTAGDWMLEEYRADRFRNPWPREHARFPFELSTSSELQVARFRRDSGQLIIASVAAPPSWRTRVGAEANRSVGIWMPSPQVRVQQYGTGDGVRMAVPCRDGVLSYEVEGAPARWWRSRTGVPALSDCAEPVSVSDVLITDPRLTRNTTLDEIPSSRIRSSLNVPRDSAVLGLFFEVYGVRPGDDVAITLGFRPRERGGLLTWLSDVIVSGSRGRMSDGTITWSLPAVAATAGVPYGIATDLDMRAAPRGGYDLTISVVTAGRRATSAPRTVVIAR
jgi:hypothetical protein